MATKKTAAPKKRRIRKPETVRQQTETAAKVRPKPRRIKKSLQTAAKPFRAAHRIGKKEYYIPVPDNRFWRFMNKRHSFIPKYFTEAFRELRQVTWPNRKQTIQLTTAVFVFAIIFSILVSITDYGLDRIFKRILIK